MLQLHLSEKSSNITKNSLNCRWTSKMFEHFQIPIIRVEHFTARATSMILKHYDNMQLYLK